MERLNAITAYHFVNSLPSSEQEQARKVLGEFDTFSSQRRNVKGFFKNLLEEGGYKGNHKTVEGECFFCLNAPVRCHVFDREGEEKSFYLCQEHQAHLECVYPFTVHEMARLEPPVVMAVH